MIHETEELDPYLWTARAPGSAEIMALEGELQALRWQPRSLALPGAAVEISRERGEGRGRPRASRPAGATDPGPERSSWWPAVAAGVCAAAAVFALLAWLRPGQGPEREPPPAAAPAGSPDLEDPFSSTPEGPGFTAPIRPDPRTAPQPGSRVSPDLKDPFAGRHQAAPPSQPKPEPKPRPKPKSNSKQHSPDLMDPFAGPREDAEPAEQQGEPRDAEPPTLTDPFSGERREVDVHSPDLKDPFARDASD